MIASTKYSQADIDILFRIDFGVANDISENLASRFIVSGYIEETPSLQATVHVKRTDLPDLFAELTLEGRTFLASIRDGLETRWIAWRP